MNRGTGQTAPTSHPAGSRPHAPAAAVAGSWAAGLLDRLSVRGVPVADYETGTGLPVPHSRRPYLHPVRTLAGAPMTEAGPSDHPHHYGLSLAVADVDGSSYWGGRTFVRDQGSTMLANHGQQCAESRAVSGPALTQELFWFDEHGRRRLSETRVIDGRALPGDTGWSLTWTSVLRATEEAVTIGSPATNGRPGAGYGGIFWRLPSRERTEVFGAAGRGEAAAHQSTSPWLAINQADGDERVGLLLSQPSATRTPWFLRSTEYVGAGPMLAGEHTVTIEPGAELTTSLRGILLDRWIADAADADRLQGEAERASREGTERP